MLLLFVATLALVCGIFNLRDRLHQRLVLADGVFWVDSSDGKVVAQRIEPGSPASRAGVYQGDILEGVSLNGAFPFEVVTQAQYVQIYLDQVKDISPPSRSISYLLVRNPNSSNPREGVADIEGLEPRSSNWILGVYLALVGLVYLAIGVYVLLKQGRGPYVTHFFLICLLAFIVHWYSPTPELRTQFDKAVDLTDSIALILLAPLFVHFAAIYPARYHLFSKRRWLALLLYLPALGLIATEVALRISKLRGLLPVSPINAASRLERVEVVLFAAGLLISCGLLLRTFWRAPRWAVVRQQLKWVVSGITIASIAFAAFYLPSFLTTGSASTMLASLAIAPFVLIPLTLGYSIVRYRLMDVDVVVRRSVAYIIATLSVALLFGSVMAASYEFLRPQLQAATLVFTAIIMSAIAMLFAPMKNWVQERVDRLFYGEKYDFRMTLQDFGRTLSSTTDLDVLLDSLTKRLKDVVSVDRLAIFVEDLHDPSGFRLARAEGVSPDFVLPEDFLQILRSGSGSDEILTASELEEEIEAPLEYMDAVPPPANPQSLHYYVPCAVRAQIVAVLAFGRSRDGALLSSEDTRLLRAISGYVAVAIENALLLEEQGRRAEELARLKEFNENIIESINVGVMVINLRGRIINWNGALESIYGLPRTEAIGKRITEVFEPEMLDALKDLMSRSRFMPREPVNVYKFHARAADGRELKLNISLAPLHSKTEEVEGTLVAIEDVTERVRLEDQLQQSDKLSSIGLLAAGVAHEVNTPLTGISSYAQMLMQQVPETDPRHALLEKIYRQTSRASAIVNNLLNFSRVTDARFGDVDVNRVLDDTIQLLEAQLRNTNIKVLRNYAEDLPHAPGSAPKLQQVFMNLIVNARDAMPEGGRLEISTEAADQAVIISFRDTGVGISPENLARIYDPFFTTKLIGEGTGLGLAVSYGIIQDHGGHIAVESKPGAGSVFQITLPRIDARHLATASD